MQSQKWTPAELPAKLFPGRVDRRGKRARGHHFCGTREPELAENFSIGMQHDCALHA
jgi:hypothetical protein